MNIIKRKAKLISKLKNKEYRDTYLAELITTGVSFQIKALREQRNRNWTQKELGDRVDMAQESISRLEDPNYGKHNLSTLKRLASAFDIGLMVRFVPFSELVNWELNLSPESLEVMSFNEESYFQAKKGDIVDHNQYTEASTLRASNNVFHMEDYLAKKASSPPQTIPTAVAGHRGFVIT